MEAEKLTPSFLAVSTMVMPVSQALAPAAVRGPPLTRRLRTRARQATSEAVLCNGRSG
jgi:hypothetical protein